jgi:hypothetical protein
MQFTKGQSPYTPVQYGHHYLRQNSLGVTVSDIPLGIQNENLETQWLTLIGPEYLNISKEEAYAMFDRLSMEDRIELVNTLNLSRSVSHVLDFFDYEVIIKRLLIKNEDIADLDSEKARSDDNVVVMLLASKILLRGFLENSDVDDVDIDISFEEMDEYLQNYIPEDFKAGLESAWSILSSVGITVEEYDAMDSFTKANILSYANSFVESNGLDTYAADSLINSAFMGLASEDIDVFFNENTESTDIDREAILTEAFSNVFAFEDVKDHEVFPFLMETIKQIELATGVFPSVQSLTDGFRVFKNVGFTNYNPEQLTSILAITCSRSVDPNTLIEDALVTNDFCSPSRAFNTRRFFGEEAEQNFINFCDTHFSERANELFLADYNIAQLLNINESDLDAFVLASLDGNAPEGNVDDLEPLVIEDIQQAIVPKVINTQSQISVTASDERKVPGTEIQSKIRKKLSPVVAYGVIGISFFALGFLANKLRKM